MKKLFDSKKGSVTDAITVIIVMFSLGVSSIIAYFIFDAFTGAMATTPFYNADVALAAVAFGKVLRVFDYVLVVVLLVVIAAQAYLNYRVAAEPAGFAGVFLLSAVVGIVGLFFSYVYGMITSQAPLVTVAGMFPSTMVILTNLHWVGFLSLLIGSITLYAKRRQGQFE